MAQKEHAVHPESAGAEGAEGGDAVSCHEAVRAMHRGSEFMWTENRFANSDMCHQACCNWNCLRAGQCFLGMRTAKALHIDCRATPGPIYRFG